MSDFKWRHFRGDIILGYVRWYCKYGISYRELEEMMQERGIIVDHTTLYRWVQHYAPEIERRLRWYYKPKYSRSWQVDETYVKVKGKWMYLYRAIDKFGDTIDFYLSRTRNEKAAKIFLGKALGSVGVNGHPCILNTDRAPSLKSAIDKLKQEKKLAPEAEHRRVKYLNNRIEADHGKLKRLIKPVRGFKSKKSAFATIKGFEIMHMFKKGQMSTWKYGRGLAGEICLIERQFSF